MPYPMPGEFCGMDNACRGVVIPFARREFRAMDKVCWAASIPSLVASSAIAVFEQEPGDMGSSL